MDEYDDEDNEEEEEIDKPKFYDADVPTKRKRLGKCPIIWLSMIIIKPICLDNIVNSVRSESVPLDISYRKESGCRYKFPAG